tara:strand:+ start:2215 stop:2424 length:210 start_codon:yes stop_codon:yes gene_type:complete
MSKPTQKDLNESIEALKSYRDRLRNEIKNISQKLHIPKNKIEITLKEHSELKSIEENIERLVQQRNLVN